MKVATHIVGTGREGGSRTLNAQAKSAARSAFESTKQRFYNHLLSAMKAPTLVKSIERDLEAGHAAVVQLVSTGAAVMERRLADIPTEEWGDLLVDTTPRDAVLTYLAHSFDAAVPGVHRQQRQPGLAPSAARRPAGPMPRGHGPRRVAQGGAAPDQPVPQPAAGADDRPAEHAVRGVRGAAGGEDRGGHRVWHLRCRRRDHCGGVAHHRRAAHDLTHPGTGAATQVFTIARRDRNEPLPLAGALEQGAKRGCRLLLTGRSHRAAVQVPAPMAPPCAAPPLGLPPFLARQESSARRPPLRSGPAGLLHGGAPRGAEKIAACWADARKIP
jgi:hypothetical protein